jgi:hypothetical protein
MVRNGAGQGHYLFRIATGAGVSAFVSVVAQTVKTGKRKAAQVLRFGQSAFLRHQHTMFNIPVIVVGMCIRIYRQHHAFFKRLGNIPPVHVQPYRICIYFNYHLVCGTGLYNSFMIYRVAFSLGKQAPGHVAQDGNIRISDRSLQAFHCFFLRHLQVAVYGCNHQVEGRQNGIGIIHFTIVEDVAFDTFENPERRKGFV